jgi:hypothetical protein
MVPVPWRQVQEVTDRSPGGFLGSNRKSTPTRGIRELDENSRSRWYCPLAAEEFAMRKALKRFAKKLAHPRRTLRARKDRKEREEQKTLQHVQALINHTA